MHRLLRLIPLLVLVVALPAWAAEPSDPAARKAMQRGLEALRKMQIEDGTWPHNEIGATALAGLTMLECDVPGSDPAIRKAAAAVRKGILNTNKTYSLSLGILFLDRLGEPADVPLIQAMGIRLLAGQNAAGGWTYASGPEVKEEDARKLEELVKERSKQPPDDGKAKPELPKELQDQLAALPKPEETHLGDNSNTQFACLALWLASRHGVPIDTAVKRLDQRFRHTQNQDGGWGYMLNQQGDMSSTPQMTCAALIGLAVSHAATKGRVARDVAKDPKIHIGLMALGTSIDHPVRRKPGVNQVPPVTNGRFYYFVWSLERVAMVYGLDTIGGKDWYTWGMEIIVANQREDGHWVGFHHDSGADTCFALLFLVRANPARDLSTTLRGGVKDPGEVVLRSGGVDGSSLQPGPRLTPALDPKKPPEGGSLGGKPLPEPKDKPPVRPPAGGDGEAARLSTRLVEARGEQQAEMLKSLRDGKGAVYTQALAGAIPRLEGEVRGKAREALAERLTRMSSETLGDKLEDEDVEVRRGAALALAMKDDKKHIGRVIALLDDKEQPVVRAAHAALKSLTGQDFGPAATATPAEHAKAVAAWKAWLAKQPK